MLQVFDQGTADKFPSKDIVDLNNNLEINIIFFENKAPSFVRVSDHTKKWIFRARSSQKKFST